jgi:GT2 family glycosyltransferase
LKLSVVILNYNVRYFLELCLQSVEAAISGIPSEIIVIDNNSTDDSCEMVVSKFPAVQLIKNELNVGFSKGNNLAVKLAKGQYVCILNPDTVVPEDGFAKIIAFAETKSNLGIIGCRLIDGSGKFLPESKRNVPVVSVAIKKILGNTKYYYANHVLEHDNAKVDVLVGAFMLVKRTVYNKLKGFDEDYFMYGEDIDLSYKSLKAGYDNYYFGNISVIHFKGESTSNDQIYLKRFYGAMQIFYIKNFKKNMFFDFLIFLGIKWMILFNSEQKFTIKPSTVSLLFSKNPNTQLVNKLNSKLASDYNEVGDENELIFDAQGISFKSIIDHMQVFKEKQCLFKIQPRNSSYVIGSSSADTKGEVIQF